MMASNQKLAPKEVSLFKNILKFYELKQYKKGLKMADQILKKSPENGETLAMKGLFCSHLDRISEAHELIKQGLKFAMKSHICWHVYGIVWRAEKNYEQAVKCYTMALKFDPENLQITRDLAFLHIQMRNYKEFNLVRHRLLQMQSSLKINWMGLAVSHHLLGEFDEAERVLNAFQDSIKDLRESVSVDYENSELLMYKLLVIEESGDLERCYSSLVELQHRILDKRGLKEQKARVLIGLARFEEAEKVLLDLIKTNPDSVDYFENLKIVRGLVGPLDAVKHSKLMDLIQSMTEMYPRSQLFRRLPLLLESGPVFEKVVGTFLHNAFRKGVPSLFSSFKDVMTDPSKACVIEKLVLEYYKNLKDHLSFTASEVGGETPSTFLWVMYFCVKLFDSQKKYTQALELVNEALLHSPTVVELLMAKARIYKHLGDYNNAMKFMNDARLMDLQDRFVNCKAVKYMLLNNAIQQAQDTLSLFTRADTDLTQDVSDMQLTWFTVAQGQAHVRLGQYGKALKQFQLVESHFVEFYDDQYDFHSYGLRKTTLCAYVAMLRMNDKLRGHPSYLPAALGAVKVYLMLFDGPPKRVLLDSLDTSNMSAAERKKAMKRAKKAEKATLEALVATAPAVPTNSKIVKKVDPDPEGKKWTDGVDYLAEATKFIKPLNDFAPENVEAWCLAIEIYLKKKKVLCAIRALKKAVGLAPKDPRVHLEKMRTVQAYHSKLDLNETVATVFESELGSLFGGKVPSLEELVKINSGFLAENPSVLSRLAVAKSTFELSGSSENALKIVEALPQASDLVLTEASQGYLFILQTLGLREAAESFKVSCHGRFPLASCFQ